MLAVDELERAAIRYANEGVQADRTGARGKAISSYQQAIETLNTLISLYPTYELNKVYIQRIAMYQARIRALKGDGVEDSAAQYPVEAHTGGSQQAQKTELIIKEKPNVKWTDVIGLEDAKTAIREAIVYPTKRPDLFPLGWPRGILMFGPPGCGKTLLAAATASEIEGTFINVDAASIMSRWLGEAEKNVAKIFSQARGTKGAVIVFIDEVDALFGTHSNEVGGEVRVRNQFLQEMDGLSEKGKSSMVYVIAATNKPWQLDAPFIRRFQKRILVTLPDLEARVHTLELYTKGLRISPEVDLRELARLTEFYSPSDIRDVCQAAQLTVVRELFESGKALDPTSRPRDITLDDFKHVISVRKPSVSREMLVAYDTWYQTFKAL